MLLNAALNMIDDAVFMVLDMSNGMDSSAAFGAFAKKAAISVASSAASGVCNGFGVATGASSGVASTATTGGSTFMNSGLKGVLGLQNSVIGSAALKGAEIMTTNVATNAINSINFKKLLTGGDAFDENGFKRGAFWNGAMASVASGMAGSAVTTKLGNMNLGVNDMKVDAFNNNQIYDMRGFNNFVGSVASTGVTYTMTGNAKINVLNASMFGSKGKNGVLRTGGLFEVNFGDNGFSTGIGMGGTDTSIGTVMTAFRGAQHWGVNVGIERAASRNQLDVATALREQYGFGDAAAQKQLRDIIAGKTILKDRGSASGDAETVTQNGQRVVYVDNYNKSGMSRAEQFRLGVTLQHEAYRDGIKDAKNQQETRDAVLAHTLIADRVAKDVKYGGLMKDIILRDVNLQTDFSNLNKALSMGSLDSFNSYVDDSYDSSRDYWKLMRDGTLVNDNKGWLVYENGDAVKNAKGEQIGAEGVETGLLNIINGGTSGISYSSYTDTQIQLAQALMTDSHMKYTEGKGGTYKDRTWANNKTGQVIDMQNLMSSVGDIVAAQVFARYYDSTVDYSISLQNGKIINANTKEIPLKSDKRYASLYATKSNFYEDAQGFVDDSFSTSFAFGLPSTDKTNYKNYNYIHFGTDLSNHTSGSPVSAGLSGKVGTIQQWSDENNTNRNWMNMEYGYSFESNFIGTGIFGEYMHFENTPTVDGFINSSTAVGTVGGTGKYGADTFKPHLHYSVYSTGDYSTTTAQILMGSDYYKDVVNRLPKYGKKTTYNPQNLYFWKYGD